MNWFYDLFCHKESLLSGQIFSLTLTTIILFGFSYCQICLTFGIYEFFLVSRFKHVIFDHQQDISVSISDINSFLPLSHSEITIPPKRVRLLTPHAVRGLVYLACAYYLQSNFILIIISPRKI